MRKSFTPDKLDVKIDFSWLIQRTLLRENVLRYGRIFCKRFLWIRITNLWGLRDFCWRSCPASPSQQNYWQCEVVPALALSASFCTSPGYSFCYLFGQLIPLLRCLCPRKRSETSVNLPSCNFAFVLCCFLLLRWVWLCDSFYPELTCSASFQQGCSLIPACTVVWRLSGSGVQFSTSYWYPSTGLSRFLWAESLFFVNPPLCNVDTVLDLL